jgi:hypothetical protein
MLLLQCIYALDMLNGNYQNMYWRGESYIAKDDQVLVFINKIRRCFPFDDPAKYTIAAHIPLLT